MVYIIFYIIILFLFNNKENYSTYKINQNQLECKKKKKILQQINNSLKQLIKMFSYKLLKSFILFSIYFYLLLFKFVIIIIIFISIIALNILTIFLWFLLCLRYFFFSIFIILNWIKNSIQYICWNFCCCCCC